MTDKLGCDLFDFVGFEFGQRTHFAVERETLKEEDFSQQVCRLPAFDKRGLGLLKTKFELGSIFARKVTPFIKVRMLKPVRTKS